MASVMPDDLGEINPMGEPLLTPEQREEIEAIKAELSAKKLALLQKLGDALESDKDKAVRWRAPIEQRWIDDLRQKHGEQPNLPEVKDQNVVPAGQGRQEEFRATRDNITYPATKQITARLADMLFPTDEKNWSLTPSPLPELADPDEVLIDPNTGQPMTKAGPPGPNGEPGQPLPLTAADIAARVGKMADQKCGRMKKQIDDALQESKYNKCGRAAIGQACDIGTGVIKGPIVRRVKQTSYQSFKMPDGETIPNLRVKIEEKPAVAYVDTWNFFPQPCRNIEEAEHAFELHLLNKKQVRDLAKQPGFDAEQVNALLQTDSDLGCLREGGMLVERDRLLSPTIETMEGRYAVWEYHGPVPRDVLEAMGMEFEKDDQLTTVSGEVWFSQGTVIKATLATDEEADRLPYYVFCYEIDPSCVFGFSVPYVMRTDQYAVNQTWHAVILNAMMSSGTQVGVMSGMMEPINGKIDVTCTKPKVWAMKNEATDIRQVLSFWNMPNFTAQLMQVYETSKRNGAEKTMLPQFMDGKAAEVQRTSSGLAMLMNSANVVQREGAKNWDDNVTVPMIGAFNRWFLLNGEDEEAKGDYQVQPKGESYLLVKDVQAQHVQVLTSIAENPRFAPYFDDYELLQLNVRTLTLPVEGLLRERQEVDAELQQQKSQPDPEVLKAQASQATADAALKRAELEAANAERDDAFRREERAMAHLERMAEIERRREADYKDVVIEDMRKQQKMMELAQQKDIDLGELETRLGIAQSREQTAQFIASMQTRLKAEDLASKERKIATELRAEAPNPRLA